MPSTSIVAKPGRQYVLKAADPEVSPSVFATVGGLRNLQVTINNNPVDITNALSEGFREWMPDGGVFDLSLSADGIFDSNTAGSQRLEEAARDRVLVEVQVVSGHGDSLVFTSVVNTFQRTGAHDNAEMFNVSLTSHGRVVRVPADS